MIFKIETPPVLSGGEVQQLRQVYGYLYRLAENLNVALNAMEQQTEEQTKQAVHQLQKAGGGTAYNELRALIVNTADVIHKEMDVIETSLSSTYVSQSDFGTFQESIHTEIQQTAEAELAKYNYSAAISNVEKALNDYILESEGYIRQGFIDYDESGAPIPGIAIGQNLRSTVVDVNGETVEQIDGTQSCAFYTANKVSFRIHGQEVAYVSNSKLYIGNAEITGSVTLGDWQLTTDRGFTIKWIG